MNIQGTFVAISISQTPWLMMYLIGSLPVLKIPIVMFAVGLVFLPGLTALIYKLLPTTYEGQGGVLYKRNLFYYMCCVFSWSCTIDLILYLEATDVIHGYMEFYLKKGEPYLGSPFGIHINLWDATVHYILYLVMIYKYDNNQSFRDFGLYWSGSMFSSMFCLLIGPIAGNYASDLHLAIFLNIPYIILPIYAFMYLFRSFDNDLKKEDDQSSKKSSHLSIMDCVLLVGMVFSIAFGLLRGFAALNSPSEFVKYYVDEYEPYIVEPGKFGTMHCLLLFVYGIPIQVIAIYGVWNGNSKWMRDLSKVFAGTIAQGTFFHLGAQLSTRSDPEYMLINHTEVVIVLNLLVAVVAHLWAFSCNIEKKKFLMRKQN